MLPPLPLSSRLRLAAALAGVYFVASSPAATAAEAQAQLVRDFAPGFYASGLAPSNLAVVGDKLYFSGSDPAHGSEPWESDGTAAGSRRLADICPGDCSSHASGFTAFGDAVLFEASDDNRAAIFKLDGGSLEKIVGSDYVSAWTVLGSHLYFISSDFRLYRSSGTLESITEMADLAPNGCPTYSNCLPLTELAPVGEVLYFSIAGSLYQLTEADGLRLLIELGGEAGEFTALGAKVVFRACGYSASGICRAFVFDPSDRRVVVLEPQGPDHFLTNGATNFRLFRGRLFFEVWAFEEPFRRVASTDGTPLGTRLENGFAGSRPKLVAATSKYLFYLSDIADGTAAIYSFKSNSTSVLLHGNQGNYYGFVGQLGDQAFFLRADPGGINPPRAGYSKLLVSAGETFNTFDLRDGYPSAIGGSFRGSLYFALEASGRSGLWKSDGSVARTSLISNGADTPASGFPEAFRVGDRLLAESSTLPLGADRLAFDVDAATLAIQQIDARQLQVLAAGTHAVLLAPDPEFDTKLFGWDGDSLEELPAVGRRGEVAVSDEGYFYFFTDAAPGQMLWESDGRANGTHLLFDFSTPGTSCDDLHGCGHQGAVAAGGNHVFFVADQDRGELPYRLSVWDRALRQKRTLYESSSYIPPLAFSRGRAIFLENNDPQGRRFWISNGTAAGTQPFFEDRDGQQIHRWLVAGERIYLVLRSPNTRLQSLWVSDGTTAGTIEVLAPAKRSFSNLAAAGDHLFFAYEDGQSGLELGFSDGTTAGTRFLDLRPGPLSSAPRNFFVTADQRLVFAAAGDDAGSEAWISDGSAAGTTRLTDLYPGDNASSPSDFAEVGSRLFFQATDGLTGRELWALDLPPAHPPCPADRLCFADDRFEAKVTAHAPNGDFVAQRAFATAESGVFTFFSPNNWEMLVKVLDGCAVNQAFWVYAAAASDTPYTLTVIDRASGAERIYESTALPNGPLLDSAAFSTCALPASDAQFSPAAPASATTSRCEDDPLTLCLGPGGRFRVAAEWQNTSAGGVALPVPNGSADAGLFTFFSPSNWELMVKVLDGCALNNQYWVFAAGTTDQGFTLKVTDRFGDHQQVYRNPVGQPARKIADTTAFSCD